jgi:hypothetical protein
VFTTTPLDERKYLFVQEMAYARQLVVFATLDSGNLAKQNTI